MKKIIVIALLVLLTIVSCKSKPEDGMMGAKDGAMMPPPKDVIVSAVIIDVTDDKAVGTFVVSRGKDSDIIIDARVTVEGVHGFHVHDENGHFNPTSVQHGLISDSEHHMGDFGNIENGRYHAIIDGTDFDAESFVGLTVNIHESEDKGSSAQPSGDAGAVAYNGTITKGFNPEVDHVMQSLFPQEMMKGDAMMKEGAMMKDDAMMKGDAMMEDAQ